MAVIKSKHASNYTILPNEIFSSGLSIQSIGLLAYLLSKPHNWVFYKESIHKDIEGMGRDKIDGLFKELIAFGYIISIREIDTKTGKYKWNHIVYDEPFNGEPHPDNQPMVDTPENQDSFTETPPTVNQPIIISKDYINNISEIKTEDFVRNPITEDTGKEVDTLNTKNTLTKKGGGRGSVKPITETTHPLCLYIKKDFESVSKMLHQLTDEQAELLVKEFTKEAIKDVLMNMENRKSLLRDYKSVYLTIRNWMKNRPDGGLIKKPFYTANNQTPKGFV